jgi:hypothetical protein
MHDRSMMASSERAVHSILRHWADVDEGIAEPTSAAQSRAIATAVERRLAEQGWSAQG